MSIQVLYATSDRVIVGMGPFPDGYQPDAGYAIAALDDSEQAAVMQDTAYLCADGRTVRAQPC